jgi:aryl-alcohol dehydrogenase-like predicted oxidoreductase
VLVDPSVQERLGELRDGGTAMGASVSGPRQAELIDRLIGLQVNGRRLFDWVQATWNLLERSAGPALQRAHDAGLRVIIKEGLANGRLSARGDVVALHEEAARVGTTPDALALAAIVRQPFADVVLSGAAAVTHLRSNLLALQHFAANLTLANVTQDPESYWNFRTHLKWT